MALADKEQILADLQFFPDPASKLEYVVSLGKTVPALPDDRKTDQFKIEGCISQLWLVPEFRDGKVYFQVDSDAIIPKGIAALLAKFYSGMTPDEILANPADFLRAAGVEQHLSMNRRNGVANLGRQIALYATAFKNTAQA